MASLDELDDPPNIFTTSSSDLPFVSGTKKYTKAVPINEITVNIQNVVAEPIASFTIGNNRVTRKAQTQLNRHAMEDAGPLIAGEKISAINIQGIGP